MEGKNKMAHMDLSYNPLSKSKTALFLVNPVNWMYFCFILLILGALGF